MLSNQANTIAQLRAHYGPAPRYMRFHCAQKFSLHYYRITKCGSTFAERLMGQLDGRETPKLIAWDNETGHAFTIIRSPLDRFFSLYFDKVLESPERGLQGIGRSMLRRGLINPNPGEDIHQHRKNCFQILGRINRTISGLAGRKPNPHWRPQAHRLSRLADKPVHLLTLDGLNWQLPRILPQHGAKIAKQMVRLGAQNKSAKEVTPSQILTPSMERIIRRIYAADERVYHEVHNFWKPLAGSHFSDGKKIKQTARGWLAFDRQALGAQL